MTPQNITPCLITLVKIDSFLITLKTFFISCFVYLCRLSFLAFAKNRNTSSRHCESIPRIIKCHLTIKSFHLIPKHFCRQKPSREPIRKRHKNHHHTKSIRLQYQWTKNTRQFSSKVDDTSQTSDPSILYHNTWRVTRSAHLYTILFYRISRQ